MRIGISRPSRRGSARQSEATVWGYVPLRMQSTFRVSYFLNPVRSVHAFLPSWQSSAVRVGARSIPDNRTPLLSRCIRRSALDLRYTAIALSAPGHCRSSTRTRRSVVCSPPGLARLLTAFLLLMLFPDRILCRVHPLAWRRCCWTSGAANGHGNGPFGSSLGVVSTSGCCK